MHQDPCPCYAAQGNSAVFLFYAYARIRVQNPVLKCWYRPQIHVRRTAVHHNFNHLSGGPLMQLSPFSAKRASRLAALTKIVWRPQMGCILNCCENMFLYCSYFTKLSHVNLTCHGFSTGQRSCMVSIRWNIRLKEILRRSLGLPKAPQILPNIVAFQLPQLHKNELHRPRLRRLATQRVHSGEALVCFSARI